MPHAGSGPAPSPMPRRSEMKSDKLSRLRLPAGVLCRLAMLAKQEKERNSLLAHSSQVEVEPITRRPTLGTPRTDRDKR